MSASIPDETTAGVTADLPHRAGSSARHARHVLVIGGAGYIGNVLLRELLRRNFQVRCFDCLLYPTGSTIAPLLDQPGFSFVRGDLRDRNAIRQSLADITDVVLLGALVGDPITKEYSDLARDINLSGSKTVFRLLAESPLADRFVFTSTCSNYGISSSDRAVTEEHPVDPRSVYAETKVSFEAFVLANAREIHFCPTVLRLSTAFGLSPRMRFDLTVSEFSRQLALGKPLIVYDEATWRPYCHVLDISEAIVRVLEADRSRVSGEIFNVGGDAGNYTKAMLVNEITKILPNSSISYERGGRDPRDYRVSFGKIKQVLDFEPRHGVPEGIARIIEGVRSGLFDDVDQRAAFYGNYVVRLNPVGRTGPGARIEGDEGQKPTRALSS
jgi:nucleoside-diphosphate-sugar epimerase